MIADPEVRRRNDFTALRSSHDRLNHLNESHSVHVRLLDLPPRSVGFRAWVDTNDSHLEPSLTLIGEVAFGIVLLRS